MTTTFLVIVFATLAYCSFGADKIVEPSTKHSFAVTHPSDKKLLLIGVGVRSLAFINLYSAGLYVTKEVVSLSAKGMKSAKEILNSKIFEDTIIKGSSDKGLVLQMYRDVGSEKLVSALVKSMGPTLKDHPKVLDQFKDTVMKGLAGKGGVAKKNTIISFLAAGSSMFSRSCTDKLSVYVDGKKHGEISSGPLCSSLFNVYLGVNAVSPALKNDIADRLFAWSRS